MDKDGRPELVSCGRSGGEEARGCTKAVYSVVVESCLEQCVSDTCSRRKRASWDALFGMMVGDFVLNQSGHVHEVALHRNGKQI